MIKILLNVIHGMMSTVTVKMAAIANSSEEEIPEAVLHILNYITEAMDAADKALFRYESGHVPILYPPQPHPEIAATPNQDAITTANTRYKEIADVLEDIQSQIENFYYENDKPPELLHIKQRMTHQIDLIRHHANEIVGDVYIIDSSNPKATIEDTQPITPAA